MDDTNLNFLKMLEPKKYDKKKNKIPLNKLFDMKNTHVMPNGDIHTGKKHTKNSKLIRKGNKKKKKKTSYWLDGVCCKNTTLESWILSVTVPSGSKIRTLKESIINGCPLCMYGIAPEPSILEV